MDRTLFENNKTIHASILLQLKFKYNTNKKSTFFCKLGLKVKTTRKTLKYNLPIIFNRDNIYLREYKDPFFSHGLCIDD